MKKPSNPRPAVVRLPPKSNFELLLQRGSQTAMIGLGLLGLVFALEAGEFLLSPIALGVTVGLMMGPVAGAAERRGAPPALSAIIVVLLFMLLIVAFMAALILPLTSWAERVPQMWQQLQEQVAQFKAPLELLNAARDQLKQLTGGEGLKVSVEDGSTMQSLAMLAPLIGTQVLVFLASLYFFIATRDSTRIAVLRVCFNRRLRWRVAHIFRDVETLVSRYLLSITFINVGQGVAVTLALWVVGVPQPALWGALAGVLNFIPYVGPAIMAVILVAVGLATYTSFAGIVMPMVVFMALHFIEAQFVTPTVIGRTMTLNPFVVFLSLAFWIWVWGPVGGFVAIPALLIVLAITRNVMPGLDWGTDRGRLPRHPL